MNMSSIIIHKSQDYDNFKTLSENRAVGQRHVEIIKKSIQQDNRLHLHPLIVKKKNHTEFFLLDGQHRLQAAKELKIPFYYVINENPTETCMCDDQISQNWNLNDYLHFYTEKGYEEYKKLNWCCREYKIKPMVIFYLTNMINRSTSRKFKAGEFVLDQKCIDYSRQSLSFRKKILETYQKNDKFERNDFIRAHYWFFLKWPTNFEELNLRLHEKFQSYPEKCSLKEHCKLLLKLYNRGKSTTRIDHPLCKDFEFD